MDRITGKHMFVRLLSALLVLLVLFPVASGTGMEVEDVPETPAYALPIDFSPGPAPKASGFSQSKDSNGNPVHVYEDSTIHVTVSQDVYKGPDGKWGYTDIWVADVTISDPSQLRVASFDKGTYDFTNVNHQGKIVDLASHVNAVVAVNGDSWGATSANEKRHYGIVFRQGKLINASGAQLDPAGKVRMDLLIVDEFGDFHGIHSAKGGDLDDPYTFEGRRVLDIFAFGPILVEDGEAIYDYQGTDREPGKGGCWMKMLSMERAQRVAFCQLGTLHYMIVVTASDSGNRGLSLPEFADYLVSKGVQFAYNLDGGVSSVLYFPGAGKNGKVNLKSRKQGRDLWDCIYFATSEQN